MLRATGLLRIHEEAPLVALVKLLAKETDEGGGSRSYSAYELESNVDLAKLLGCTTATLYRVMTSAVAPSSSFIARTKLAFPSDSIDSLFYVDRLGATAGLVAVEWPTGLVA
ncbi:hypothetical protein QUG92_06450 [Curtobacterium sp. RHCKG23]|uniref:Uncharacterized protein n=1 Tax=Curtobacterium citri TaxID=3055139 RepID=A0ABT7T5A5_9MICO|nr:hypothetical protein [Curtobacterium citri]MDM7884743.1 hypothetical protein [Curtobacterium citri]